MLGKSLERVLFICCLFGKAGEVSHLSFLAAFCMRHCFSSLLILCGVVRFLHRGSNGYRYGVDRFVVYRRQGTVSTVALSADEYDIGIVHIYAD